MSTLTFLSIIFFVAGFLLAWFFWLSPLLRTRPSFREFYARSDSFWRAVYAKFAFVKTRIAAGLLMLASGLLWLHDFAMPVAIGIDWMPLWTKVPSWCWPLLSFAIGLLFYWLRHVTTREQDQVIAAVQDGASVHQAVMMVAEPMPLDPKV